MTRPKYSVKTENLTAESGAQFLIEQLKKDCQLSITHIVWIESVCQAIETNTKREIQK